MSRSPSGRSGFKLNIFTGVIFTIAAVGVFLLLNMTNLQEFIQTRQERDKAHQENELLKEKIKLLKRKQQSLARNGGESEKQVRERLGMHKKGEKVIFFRNEAETATSSGTMATTGGASIPLRPPQTDAIGEKNMPVNKPKQAK